MKCPKCNAVSGDDWEQCNGLCPMEGSPHYGCWPAYTWQEEGEGTAIWRKDDKYCARVVWVERPWHQSADGKDHRKMVAAIVAALNKLEG